MLAERFRQLAVSSLPRAPLNAALSSVIARHRDLYGLLGHAPETQQSPVLLLAAIHDQVLATATDGDVRVANPDLRDWYPTVADTPRDADDPELERALRDFVAERAATISGLVASRHTQTNEVGRCALFLHPLRLLEREMGPLGRLDVGASAGLTLLLDRYVYRFDDGPTIRGSQVASPELLITCSSRGGSPLPDGELAVPEMSAVLGIDATPVDVSDRERARWLEACCWPDQTDRIERLRAAIDIARRHPPEILRGDAVDRLVDGIERVAASGHPVVTTSWALSYLTASRRQEFVDRLDQVGGRRDLSFVFAESPAQTAELPHPADLDGEHITALVTVTWRDGERSVRPLATCHPHGYWIHWR